MPKPKYIMSREERQSALAALKLVLPRIWDGHGPYNFGSRFICVALDNINRTLDMDSHDAVALIERSLGRDNFTLEHWVVANNVMALDLNKGVDGDELVAMQAYRKLWVQHLIDSLEESLK